MSSPARTPLLILACVGAISIACGEGSSGVVLGELSDGLGGSRATDPLGSGGAPEDPDGTGGAEDTSGAGGQTEELWLSQACSPEVIFDNQDTSADGERIETLLGDPDQLVVSAAQNACRILYQTEDEVPEAPQIIFVLEPTDSPGSVGGAQMRLGTGYLLNYESNGGDVSAETNGIVHFLITHIYQHAASPSPGWLISAKADYVRLSSGWLAESERSPGGVWTDGYRTAAFFLDYLTQTDPDFIYRLNGRMSQESPVYSDALFLELTGTSLPDLWDQYQQSFP